MNLKHEGRMRGVQTPMLSIRPLVLLAFMPAATIKIAAEHKRLLCLSLCVSAVHEGQWQQMQPGWLALPMQHAHEMPHVMLGALQLLHGSVIAVVMAGLTTITASAAMQCA